METRLLKAFFKAPSWLIKIKHLVTDFIAPLETHIELFAMLLSLIAIPLIIEELFFLAIPLYILTLLLAKKEGLVSFFIELSPLIGLAFLHQGLYTAGAILWLMALLCQEKEPKLKLHLTDPTHRLLSLLLILCFPNLFFPVAALFASLVSIRLLKVFFYKESMTRVFEVEKS